MTGSDMPGGWVATLDRGYSAIVKGMMGLAAIYVGLMMVVIIYYTTFRSLGWSYNPYSFVFIEYGFLYVLMLGCPWMVRQRAHVYIELLTAAMPDGPRRLLSRLICLTCAAVCAVLAVYTGLLAWEDSSWNRFTSGSSSTGGSPTSGGRFRSSATPPLPPTPAPTATIVASP